MVDPPKSMQYKISGYIQIQKFYTFNGMITWTNESSFSAEIFTGSSDRSPDRISTFSEVRTCRASNKYWALRAMVIPVPSTDASTLVVPDPTSVSSVAIEIYPDSIATRTVLLSISRAKIPARFTPKIKSERESVVVECSPFGIIRS